MRAKPAQQEALLHPWEDFREFSKNAFEIHTAAGRRGELSFPPVSDQAPPTAAGTVLRFAFWAHVKENQKSLIPFLEGCDVLAMESVYTTSHDDMDRRQMANGKFKDTQDLLGILVTGQYDDRAARRLKRRGLNPDYYLSLSAKKRQQAIKKVSGPSEREILRSFMDRIEALVSLDCDPEHAGRLEKLEAEAVQKRDDFKADVDSGVTWKELGFLARDMFTAESAIFDFRESITRRQLANLTMRYPDRTIGVVYGSAHQALTRRIDMPNVSLQRQFIPDNRKVEPFIDQIISAENALKDGLTLGLLDDQLLDHYLVLKTVARFGEWKTLKRHPGLPGEELEALSQQLKSLREEVIPAADTDALERLLKRNEVMAGLVKRALRKTRR